jgi:hypothetical protein
MARTFETGYTPGLQKKEMLGAARVETAEERSGKIEYQTFDDAVESARERQPGNPADPEPRFASDLHFTTAGLLELDELESLKFFTGVNGPLARFHKIDSFFELQPDPGKPDIIRVTLELTTDDNKRVADKADLLIHVPVEGLDPTDPKDKDAFATLTVEASKRISAIIEKELTLLT